MDQDNKEGVGHRSQDGLHVRKSSNPLHDLFHSYKFTKEHTVENHLLALKRLASSCEFGDQSELKIREKILSEYGDENILKEKILSECVDENILETLRQKENVTLEEVFHLITAKEKIKSPCVVKPREKLTYDWDQILDNQQEIEETSGYSHQNTVSNEEINTVIDCALNDCMTLNEVTDLIQNNYGLILSKVDKTCIHRIYSEKLLELWLDETSEIVVTLFDYEHPLNLFDQVTSVKSLEDCFAIGLNLPYNDLMRELWKHGKHSKIQEHTQNGRIVERCYILKFKETSLCFMIVKMGYLQGELKFLQNFVKALKSTKDVEELCNSLSATALLKTRENERDNFKKFLQNIIALCDSKNIFSYLKATANTILEQDRYFFIQHVKDTVEAYLKPLVLTESSKDGRKLLEVKGEHIVLSKILQEIEKMPSFSEVVEVRFVEAGVIHVDENVYAKLWHGKNVVLYAETVIVSVDKTIIWDVSGNDAENIETEAAGTGSNGAGLDGEAGLPGESGGNILLICKEIENPTNFKIVSNGGKGGKGQDGGDGKDGNDGDYLSHVDFKKKFPPASRFIDESKRENLKKTMSNVIDNVQDVKLLTLGNLKALPIEQFDYAIQNCVTNLRDFYFEAKTKSGCQIVFSFYYGKLFEFCQSFLLHKGADGELGMNSGKGGSGGKGGFSGEVEFHIGETHEDSAGNIIVSCDRGEDGEPGKTGIIGKPGKSGIDCAYTDRSLRSTKYFLTTLNDCQRLTVMYHQEKHEGTIYCPLNWRFAEITKAEKMYSQSCFLSKSQTRNVLTETKSNFIDQANHQATRKKTINSENIVDQYSHKSSMVDWKKLADIEDYIKKKFAEINEEILQQEQITKETTVTRQIDFTPNDQHKLKLDCVVPDSSKTNALRDLLPVERLISMLEIPTDEYVWAKLAQAKISLKQLRDLWGIINSQNSELTFSDKLCEKLSLIFSKTRIHLAVLENIEETHIELKTPPPESYKQFCPKPVGSVESCLTLCDERESLSDVESYLYNDSIDKRNHLIKLIIKSGLDDSLLINIFNLHLDSNGHEVLPSEMLSIYIKHYNWFKHKKGKDMLNKLLHILNYFNANKKQRVYERLVKALIEQNMQLKIDIENEIHNCTLLKLLYDKYIAEVKKTFVWKSKVLHQQVVVSKVKEGFREIIIQKGPLCVYYREVVAWVFKTNVLLYGLNEHNQMVLLNNHNPSGQKVIHVLIKDNKFFKLKVNECMCEMFKLYDEKEKKYNQIKLHFDSIIDNEPFSQLVADQPIQINYFNDINKSDAIRVKVRHMMMEDENIQLISNSFELDEEKQLIHSRLIMLKHEYIGYHSALYYIAEHMRAEGNHLTVKHFCCIINFVLKSLLCVPPVLQMVSWILAAYHQTKWLAEFLLLKLEISLKELLVYDVKENWRKYLHEANKDTLMLFLEKLDNDYSLENKQSIEEVILLLSQIPDHYLGLSQLCLSEWKYFLKDIFWIYKVKDTGDWSEEDLKLASFYLMALENSVGKDLCCRFVEMWKSFSDNKKPDQQKAVVLKILKHFANEKTSFNHKILEQLSCTDISRWEEDIEDFSSPKDVRSLEKLGELIKSSDNTSELILNNLNDLLKDVRKTTTLLKILKHIIKDEETRNKSWISSLLTFFKEKEIKAQDKKFEELLENMYKSFPNKDKCHEKVSKEQLNDFLKRNLDEVLLATICMSISIEFGITLRDTQILTILTFLKTGKNLLGQVSTGEGKSYIIISLAIMKSLNGRKVDIITSSRVLAKRDALAYNNICSKYGLIVGDNCSEDVEERKSVYSSCHVIYGELAFFQRDYLLDQVYDKNILGDHNISEKVVLIDEVDSMLLDKGNNVLYLSHDMPGLDKLEPLFVFIWKCLKIPHSANNFEDSFTVDQLKDKIVYEMYGQIRLEDIKYLDTTLEAEKVIHTWEMLKERGVIDSSGKVLLNQYDESKFVEFSNADSLKYLFKKVINREKQFEIPNYLKYFVEEHLVMWIESAIDAMNLKNNIDYVIDVDRSNESSDRNPNIIIIDRDTGTDLINSQWDQGLHQFLQLKHGCRISPLTYKAVFISNVTYLKLYKTLFGLTGTLGSSIERGVLEDFYKVEFVTIPTAKAKDFTEKPPILCNSTSDWSDKIFKELHEVTTNRSALIICDSVSDVFLLEKTFQNLSKYKLPKRRVYTYTRDYEEFKKGDLEPSCIIISTNLAGRGTDIKLSKELIDTGGLHVCLSFLPNNCRIEEQAFGRAARNGEPGSGQLIFRNVGKNNISRVIDLKKEINFNEILRISSAKKDYEKKIKQEEKWFSEFLKIYASLKKSNHKEEAKSILLMSCLDQWAIWLENQSTSKCPVSIEELTKNILKLCNDDFNVWSQAIQDPFQLTRLGLLYFEDGDNIKALQLFDHVIKNEPVFSEAAYYYKVCTRASKDDIQIKDLKDDLEVVEEKLKGRIESSLMSGHFINWLKNHNSRTVVQVDSFLEQQKIISETYGVFIESIYNIIGHPVTINSFNNVTPNRTNEVCNDKISSIIFYDFIRQSVIKQYIKSNITDNDLHFVSKYGISPERMKQVLDSCNTESKEKKCGREFENYVFKQLKNETDLPSREMFWKELVRAGILQYEEKYVFIDIKRLNKIDPSLAKKIKALAIDMSSSLKNKLSLYSLEELEQVKLQYSSVFLKSDLKQKIRERWNFLRQENLVIVNKQATVSDSVKAVELKYFDSISQEDFLKIGISSTTAASIIEDLINQRILGVREKYKHEYILLIDCESVHRIELTSHKAYLDDVKVLISHCFAFRIALQKFQHLLPLCEGNYNIIPLPLQTNLYKKLWIELLERGIIKRTLNQREQYFDQLRHLYCNSMTKERYIEIFADIYGKKISMQIVDELISTGWLKKKLSLPYTDILYGINYCNNTNKANTPEKLPSTYKGNSKEILPCFEDDTKAIILIKHNKLSVFKDEAETIELVLIYYIILSNSVKSIEKRLNHLAGKVDIDTPSFFLQPLHRTLNELSIPTSEIILFTKNGFDHLLVLEDKKYTKKMKRNTTIITILALTEIAVGVSLWSPVGLYFISQGIDDLIFVTSCAFSGFFKWRSYIFNKIISLVTVSLSLFKNFQKTSNIGKSVFATEAADIALPTLKERCCILLSRIKSSVKGLPTCQVPETLTKSEIATHVIKRLLVHTGEAIAYGTSFAVMDQVIETAVGNMDELLTNYIYADIYHTIANHAILQCAEELCHKFNETERRRIIESGILKIIQDHQVTLDKSFDSIDLNTVRTLIERTSSIGFRSNFGGLDQILRNSNIVFGVVKAGWSYLKRPSELVTEILNEMQQFLQKEMIKLGEVRTIEVERPELDGFKWYVTTKLERSIKGVLVEHIQTKILAPVLRFVESCFLKHSFAMVSKLRKSFFTNEEINEFTQNRRHSFQRKIKKESDQKEADFFHSEFMNVSHELLKIRKNKKMLSHLENQNAPIELYCLELCSKLIPVALKQHGMKVPSLRIVLEKTGKKHVFHIGDTRSETSTLHITPDAGLNSNLKNNKFLLKDWFAFVSKYFEDNYPECRGLTATVLHNMVLKAIDYFGDSQPIESSENEKNQSYDQDWVCEESKQFEVSEMNIEYEKKNPSKHSHVDGSWAFSRYVDVDLRETFKLTDLTNFHSHILKGFEMALVKINNHIHKIQDCFRSFNLVLDDFSATKHKLSPPLSDSMSECFYCYAVQYHLIVPLMLNCSNTVDFTINMRLENEKFILNKAQPYSPRGPHILYEINPLKQMKFLSKGVRGHILLNIDCANENYTIKDCNVAGELILLSSVLSIPKATKERENEITEELNANSEMGSKDSEWKVEDEGPDCVMGGLKGESSACEIRDEMSKCVIGGTKGEDSACEVVQRTCIKDKGPNCVMGGLKGESSACEVGDEGPDFVMEGLNGESSACEEEDERSKCVIGGTKGESSSCEVGYEGPHCVMAGVKEESSACEVGGERPTCFLEGEGSKKECSILIIGDSMFKYIYQYIALQKCDFGHFPYIQVNQLKSKILSFLCKYTGVKCVIVFLGNDIVKTNVHEKLILNCISNLIEALLQTIQNVEIVMCTLTLTKSSATKYQKKILYVNNRLIDYCHKNNVKVLDTCRIICPQDLCVDGIHLNRKGYFKLGQHITNRCKEIFNLN